MSEFIIEDAYMTLSVEYTGAPIVSESIGLRNFLTGITNLNGTVPLDKFKLIPVQGQQGKYTYTFDAKDGRKFKQVISLVTTPARFSFDTADLWAEVELIPHRALRESTISMIGVHSVTKINCEWV